MKKSVKDLTVISNRKINKDHSILELKSEVLLEDIVPGQFANLLVDRSRNVFLRRPFSIFQVDYKCNSFTVLIKIVGEGTKCLAECEIGDKISTIFPLGKGYSFPEKKSKLLLVGGGVGIAPLMMVSRRLKNAGHKVDILLGARRESDLIELDAFADNGTVHTTTEDGSHGIRGYVTDHTILYNEICSFDKVYCCGPEPMMKAVARIAWQNNVECEVSLENTMACGYGVCLCCVTDTIDGHRCVCTEGPVFDIKQLKWHN